MLSFGSGSAAATILEKSLLGNTGTLCLLRCFPCVCWGIFLVFAEVFQCFSFPIMPASTQPCVATVEQRSAEWPWSCATSTLPFLWWHMGCHRGRRWHCPGIWGVGHLVELIRLFLSKDRPWQVPAAASAGCAVVWIKDMSHLPEVRFNSWHREGPAGMVNSCHEDALN